MSDETLDNTNTSIGETSEGSNTVENVHTAAGIIGTSLGYSNTIENINAPIANELSSTTGDRHPVACPTCARVFPAKLQDYVVDMPYSIVPPMTPTSSANSGVYYPKTHYVSYKKFSAAYCGF